MITFGSLCSGIEAASEAWIPLGWTCAYVAEVEPFPCGYLAARHGAGRPLRMPSPEDTDDRREAARRRAAIKAMDRITWADRLTNFGDVSQIQARELPPVDIIAAGFPCQDFSIAGLRASLSGGRGSLSITGVRLILEAAELGLVRGAVLEQVPDVLNTTDNAWGNILGALVGADDPLEGLDHGGKWPRAGMVAGPRSRIAWRILDAQHFGLAQRRERVWAVVDFGDGPDPAAVLFERKGVPGNPPARREAGEGVAPTLAGGARERGGFSYDDIPVVRDGPQRRAALQVAPTLLAQGNRTGGDRPPGTTVDTCESLIPVAYSIMPQNSGKDYKAREVDVAQPLMAGGPVGGNQGGDFVVQPIAFNARQDPISGPVVGPVDTDGTTHAVAIRTNQTGANGSNISEGLAYPVAAQESPQAIAFSLRGREGGAQPEVESGDVSPALRSAEGGSTRPFVAAALAVRRITVVEACRLQGFPDLATLIPWPTANRKGDDLAEQISYLIGHGLTPEEAASLAQTPDGPQYRALGNSWPVNVARWIGERIAANWTP